MLWSWEKSGGEELSENIAQVFRNFVSQAALMDVSSPGFIQLAFTLSECVSFPS